MEPILIATYIGMLIASLIAIFAAFWVIGKIEDAVMRQRRRNAVKKQWETPTLTEWKKEAK